MSLTAAASTMFLTVILLIALSLGTHLEQLTHLTGLTCPLPLLFLPLDALFFGIFCGDEKKGGKGGC